MDALSLADRDALGDMLLGSLEVRKTPVTQFDVAIKSYVDSKFDSAVASSTQAVTDLVAGAPGQLDTLKEISTALGDNANLASVLTTSIASVSSAVTAEAVSRAQADVGLTQTLNQHYNLIIQEQTDRAQNVATLQGVMGQHWTEITQEQTTRQESDVQLQNQQNIDRNDRVSATVALNYRVDVEAQARFQADEVLSRLVTDETKYREEAFTTLVTSKLDVSPFYSGGSESHLKISTDAFLYIGDLWRIRANTAGVSKRLEFQYSPTGLEQDFKTAVPFIRGA